MAKYDIFHKYVSVRTIEICSFVCYLLQQIQKKTFAVFRHAQPK